MYGYPMLIETERIKLVLRPFTKGEVRGFVPYFGSMVIHEFTAGMSAPTVEDEEHWYDKTREDKDGMTWAVVPDGETEPIGMTSLHKITDIFGGSSSGFICYKPEWWNKGLASAAHLGRTMYAADYLNRSVINSSVRSRNIGSRKALERVGYTVWGTELITIQRGGKFLSTDHLQWFHPERTALLFPDGVPTNKVEGIEKAKMALDLARKVVKFI